MPKLSFHPLTICLNRKAQWLYSGAIVFTEDSPNSLSTLLDSPGIESRESAILEFSSVFLLL